MASSWLDMSGWAMVLITLGGAYLAGRQRRRKEHDDQLVTKSGSDWQMSKIANEMIHDLRETETQLRGLLVSDRKMIETLEQALSRGRDMVNDLRDIVRRLVRILDDNDLPVPLDAREALRDEP